MSAVGKILIAVAEIGAVIALNALIPGGGLIVAGLHISAFAALAIGSVIITAAFGLLTNILFKPTAAKIDQSKINVRLSNQPRYLAGGVAMMGGGVVFGEFDSAGNLWYIILHCDSILAQTIQYYFDDKPVTFDGTGDGEGWCISDDFCLDDKKNLYNAAGGGQRFPYFYVWTRTSTEANPVPPAVAALQAAFPDKWTTVDHLLVGTTYSVIRCSPIKLEDRFKIFRWRGSLGMGEPSISIVGSWSNMYDPRDPAQTLGDRTTYKPSSNAEIVWAWFRTHPFGRNKPEASINWNKVAEQADICDQSITGIESTQPRYACGTAVVDSKARSDAEAEIMLSCDGQLSFDEQGKSWLRVGHYYEPTLMLSRNRDIIAMQSVEAQNGESETQGIIVTYLDPTAGFQSQPSAPWYNPHYYVEGEGNTFLTVEILTCQNHNQAMRLAKAIGLRSQPIHKLAPSVGLRGLRAMGERIVNITYDNTFAGDYEIATPVEVDESGMFCSLGLVPIDQDRFDLLAGEEKSKPVVDTTTSTSAPANVTGVTASINNGRIEAYFSYEARDDATLGFQYLASADLTSGNWGDMTVDMNNGFAFSGPIDVTQSQKIRWRAVSAGGQASAWSDPYTIGVTVSPSTALTVTGGVGQITVAWRNPTDSNFSYTDVWRGTTDVFSEATKIIANMAGGLGQVQQITDTVTAGTDYYWVVAHTTDNASATPNGPAQGTAT